MLYWDSCPHATVVAVAKANINLLPQGEFESSTIGRVLRWGMNTFRIIVIATEAIVMAAFLSRFWLDAQNSDLNDSIKLKANQISSQSQIENQFRDLQNKLKIAGQIGLAAHLSLISDDITSKVPLDVTLNGLSVTAGNAQIKGVSNSELGIAQFLANLKSNTDYYDKVDLQQIGTSQANANQISFSIQLTYH